MDWRQKDIIHKNTIFAQFIAIFPFFRRKINYNGITKVRKGGSLYEN